ncbi:L-lactate utilization operon repressor [Pragia fontium]|uniref:GntR family transcriptional regulator n=1 Tax=Pragia fontium TaxID=82985 RepID=A0ABQ5LL86_9GAMM|nr:transcriptional regulator ExuR [Pragia fontium]AKJ40807.1 transcriptional regulator [Pragia fontium]GKX64329.1 GntR family transcriptional regulator [Pragia fontium]SUB80986.1 L-lactate utilization operon repressor [Pragia fontium]
MEVNESPRLYQQIAAELKKRLEHGIYHIGDKLPAERLLSEEMNVSRTVVREALIMLEVEGYVDVRKGSGIHVIANQPKKVLEAVSPLEFARFGPFELLQARQLIESNIAEFAATQVTRQDIVDLVEIQQQAQKEDRFRDSEWDFQFHVRIARITHNNALISIVERMWSQRLQNPYWLKLHEHVQVDAINSWCEDHEKILQALINQNPAECKLAMWQHLENTKQMLFDATANDFEFNVDRFMFAENPVVYRDFSPLKK